MENQPVADNSTAVLAFDAVSKAYAAPNGEPRHVLHDVSFEAPAGRRIAIVGRSGSGKSTLLHLAAGIDVPTGGDVRVMGRSLAAMSESERTVLRRDLVGLVFQFFYLMPHLSVRDNVALPALIAGDRPRHFEPRVAQLLDRVGLGDRANERVQKLSGGEMQRVAICRALMRRPHLLLADEPTGNLDDENGRRVMELMLSLVAEEGGTLIFVTHSREVSGLADEVWRLHSGVLSPYAELEAPTAPNPS